MSQRISTLVSGCGHETLAGDSQSPATPVSGDYPNEKPDLLASLRRKDTPQNLLARCKVFDYKIRKGQVPEWHLEVTQYYMDSQPRWGFLQRAETYLHNGQIKKTRAAPRYPHARERMPLDPSMVLAHLVGREIIYIGNDHDYKIDIDNKGGRDPKGLEKNKQLVYSILPQQKLFGQPSRGCGYHIAFKSAANPSTIRQLYRYLSTASCWMQEDVSVIDSKVCGSRSQLVSMPFFRTEQEWQQYRDLELVEQADIQKATRKLVRLFPGLKRLQEQQQLSSVPTRVVGVCAAVTPALALSVPTRVVGAQHPLWQRFIKYADHRAYADRWEAMYLSASVALRMGMDGEQFIGSYRQFIGDQDSDPADLARAYKYSLSYLQMNPRAGKQAFSVDPAKLDGLRNRIDSLCRAKGRELTAKELAATTLWNYCLLRSDTGGVSRKGFIALGMTRVGYENARIISRDFDLSREVEPAIPPRYETRTVDDQLVLHRIKGRAAIYKVCDELREINNP